MSGAGPFRLTFLGTGTSTGVPAVGCPCEVCRSEDPRDKRLRASILLEFDGRAVVVDTGTDFRQQALRVRLDRLDAVLFTHDHADHIFGLDDIRPFNFRTRRPVPCYADARTADFEPNYLASIEFDIPDFPWLFTPAAAGTDGKLRPWLVLAVVKSEVATLGGPRGTPLPQLNYQNGSGNVLTSDQSDGVGALIRGSRWMEIATPPPEGCAIGIGTSPPARKLASLPLSATRFGSARLSKRPRSWSARTTPAMPSFES